MDRTAKPERIWELDALRGVSILCVIFIHFIFDLNYFLGLNLNFGPVFHAVQTYGGTVFVVLSGVCVTLGHRSFRRGLIVFGCGMGITAVTAAMAALGMTDENIVIWFGVLHLLGICMLSYPLWRRVPDAGLAIGSLALVLSGYVLQQFRFSVRWLFPLGIISPDFVSGDYFPLLPYLGWFALGVVLGRRVYAQRRTRLPHVPAEKRPIRFFRFCGRHSLWIYLGHQPLLYALTMILSNILHCL